MPEVLADTFHWIALLNPADKWHEKARLFSQNNPKISLVTTESVLAEMLNYFSGAGALMRQAAAELCAQTMTHASTVVLPHTREVFVRGSTYIKSARTKAIASRIASRW